MDIALRLKQIEDSRDHNSWDFDDENFCRDDWKAEVGCGDTQLGYFDWVSHKYEAANESGIEL